MICKIASVSFQAQIVAEGLMRVSFSLPLSKKMLKSWFEKLHKETSFGFLSAPFVLMRLWEEILDGKLQKFQVGSRATEKNFRFNYFSIASNKGNND